MNCSSRRNQVQDNTNELQDKTGKAARIQLVGSPSYAIVIFEGRQFCVNCFCSPIPARTRSASGACQTDARRRRPSASRRRVVCHRTPTAPGVYWTLYGLYPRPYILSTRALHPANQSKKNQPVHDDETPEKNALRSSLHPAPRAAQRSRGSPAPGSPRRTRMRAPTTTAKKNVKLS